MSDLMPMDQVTTVEDRETGEIFEGRGEEIIIIIDPANGRVGITT